MRRSYPFPGRRRSPWRWILITLGGLTTLAAVFFITLLLSFRMGGEARALRQAVLAATPGEWAPRFEFGVGRLPAWLARAGFHLAEGKIHLLPEARFGIDAFRSADIGVYRRHHASSQDSSSAILAKVDSSMAAQDWESIVSVQDAQHNVRIFVPKKPVQSPGHSGLRVRHGKRRTRHRLRSSQSGTPGRTGVFKAPLQPFSEMTRTGLIRTIGRSPCRHPLISRPLASRLPS